MPFPALVGATEIAELLGVSRQRVQQLANTPGFPAAVAELKMGKIWLRSDVDAWIAARADARRTRGENRTGNDGKRPNAHHLAMPLVREERSH